MRLPSLRARIFISLIFLVLVASLLIAGVTIFQYSEQSNAYHEQRLERKENQLKKQIYYLLQDAVLEEVADFVLVENESIRVSTALFMISLLSSLITLLFFLIDHNVISKSKNMRNVTT